MCPDSLVLEQLGSLNIINLHLLAVSLVGKIIVGPVMAAQANERTTIVEYRCAELLICEFADCKILVDSHLSSNSRRIGDGIILKQMTVEVLKTVAHVLAQSVALDYHGK